MESVYNLSDYKYHLNRELSWLEFEERVLSQACDAGKTILEHLKFLSITSSNLDEFFIIRVATLMHMMAIDDSMLDIAGLKPSQQLDKISVKCTDLVSREYEIWSKQKKELRQLGVSLIDNEDELTLDERQYLEAYFTQKIFPILTPVIVDSSRPFPIIKSMSLNVGFIFLNDSLKNVEFGFVQLPENMPRLIETGEKSHRFILLENLISICSHFLFPEYKIENSGYFRISRNADFELLLEEGDILTSILNQVKNRQWSNAVRLEVSENLSPKLVGLLLNNLNLCKRDLYTISDSLDLTFLNELLSLDFVKEQSDKKDSNIDYRCDSDNKSIDNECINILEKIEEGDMLLFHPYESFDPVVDFINQAADNPEVLAIKQTLYRTAAGSQVVNALIRAAQNGKQVTVLVELKARFDERKNIEWAHKLEEAGCIVLYGTADLKVHCKITLVIKRHEGEIRNYIHLGTGNYNEVTARLYTDIGMMTCKEEFGRDAVKIFNMLSGYNKPDGLEKLSMSPYGLKEDLIRLIRHEKQYALAGKDACIKAKMNSLCDPDIIRELYEASIAGVKIRLLVRGICSLIPGLQGISENIEVKSIVGNYLEHSRIYSFMNGGNWQYYLASADCMPRNFERRIELMFPIEGNNAKEKLNRVLTLLFEDNRNAHTLSSDGKYIKCSYDESNEVDSQILLEGLGK